MERIDPVHHRQHHRQLQVQQPHRQQKHQQDRALHLFPMRLLRLLQNNPPLNRLGHHLLHHQGCHPSHHRRPLPPFLRPLQVHFLQRCHHLLLHLCHHLVPRALQLLARTLRFRVQLRARVGIPLESLQVHQHWLHPPNRVFYQAICHPQCHHRSHQATLPTRLPASHPVALLRVLPAGRQTDQHQHHLTNQVWFLATPQPPPETRPMHLHALHPNPQHADQQ